MSGQNVRSEKSDAVVWFGPYYFELDVWRLNRMQWDPVHLGSQICFLCLVLDKMQKKEKNILLGFY